MSKSHHAAPRARKIRTAKTGNAATAIGPLTPGIECYCLTYGHFSLIDALVYLVEQTGPADVLLSTWTAADSDLTAAARLVEQSKIRTMRLIVDGSFLTRQPAYCAKMRQLFGDDCIRTTRTHAKFATITNDNWNLAVRTSMNLNENPRLENIEISDDPALAGFLLAVAAELFGEQKPGDYAIDLPMFANLPDHGAPPRVSMGKATAATSRIATGPSQ